jgi:hypothetical protein
MSNKPFKEVKDGELFTLNNINYQKIKEVKISCCKRINAQACDNNSNRIKVDPDTEVTTND